MFAFVMNGNHIDLWCCMVSQETLVGGPNCPAPQRRDVDGSAAAMVTMAIQTMQSYREKQNTDKVYILDINHISLMNFLDREISAINSPQQFLNSNPLVSLFDHEPHFTTLQRSVYRKTLETSSVL